VSNTWTDLLAAVGVAPALPGARCRGKHHLYDDAEKNEAAEVVAQRHAQALQLCSGCTALASCATWFESLPPSRRPPGVVAGRLSAAKTVGRPRRSA
jgi:WhiB family redox-sensing transcriptional regulator